MGNTVLDSTRLDHKRTRDKRLKKPTVRFVHNKKVHIWYFYSKQLKKGILKYFCNKNGYILEFLH